MVKYDKNGNQVISGPWWLTAFIALTVVPAIIALGLVIGATGGGSSSAIFLGIAAFAALFSICYLIGLFNYLNEGGIVIYKKTPPDNSPPPHNEGPGGDAHW